MTTAAQLDAWAQRFTALLAVARPGAQFPDATRWRDLASLVTRPGPKGRPQAVAISTISGLPTRRYLARLLRLQFVAREFFAKHRARPSKEARAFYAALAAVELPPVSETRVSLVARGPDRFTLVHDRLDLDAVRFTVQLAQAPGRKHVLLDRANLARPSERLLVELDLACRSGDARDAWLALGSLDGLEVLEVTRGQLGPFVGPFAHDEREVAPDVSALRRLVAGTGGAVLSLALERVGSAVRESRNLDPWLADAGPLPRGVHSAKERRLCCSPELEPALKALARELGKPVLVKSR